MNLLLDTVMDVAILLASHLHNPPTAQANMFLQGCNGSWRIPWEDTAVTIMLPNIS
jgi:hypothetical protein